MKRCIATSRDQRGAATVLAAVFLVISVSLMVVASLNMSASDVTDTALHSDAIEALFLAESGVEYSAYDYASGTTCLDLAPSGPVNLARGTFQVAASFESDFSGAALPSGQCRIEVTGQAGVRNSLRRISVILRLGGGNLLASDNADFNDPEGSPGPPDGWALSPGGWDDNGGPDASRSAYVDKASPGPLAATTAGSFGMSGFTVTAPTTLVMDFDYRVARNPAGGPPNEMSLTFGLLDSAGNSYTHADFQSGHTGSYTSGSISIDIPGSGPVDITTLEFELVAKAGARKEIWLDNLVLTDPGTPLTTAVTAWQELVQ